MRAGDNEHAVNIEELAEIAYSAYWERVTAHNPPTRTPFKLQSEFYKEDWRKVVRQVTEKTEQRRKELLDSL